jgi:hypothetical protein
LPPWQLLLHRTVDGISRLRSAGHLVPHWILGGGTGLMIRIRHRSSKDIDAFIDDPQYLSLLSPRLAGESVWSCDAYDESAHHLKLVFPEGEIDFIVAAKVTELASSFETIDVSGISAGVSHKIEIEHPVETAMKKFAYRGPMLKIRDMVDIAVVDALFPGLLRANLHHVAHLKTAILARLDNVSEEYLRLELDELDISDGWRRNASSCHHHVREIIAGIPG